MEKISDRIFLEDKERLARLGIKAVLFDLDDTLIFTSEIFAKYMNEYVTKVAAETGIDSKVINECLRRINDEEYKKMGVNPSRWGAVVIKMAEEFKGNEAPIINNLDILMKIYTEEPRIRPGAKDILERLRRSGIKIGLVTHANVDWTWRKLESVGMIDCFDTIHIADENSHKGVDDWKSTMLDLEVTPNECLIVGDSLGGDIIPTAQIGTRTMWLHKGSTWSMYRTGEIPESTLMIDEISELLSALDQLR